MNQYGCFTVTRLLSAVLSKRVSSRRLLWITLGGSLASLCFLLLTLVPLSKPVRTAVIWVGSGVFGACEGPLWPAMMSLLTEELGLELRTTHTVSDLPLLHSMIPLFMPHFTLFHSSLLYCSSTCQALVLVMSKCGYVHASPQHHNLTSKILSLA